MIAQYSALAVTAALFALALFQVALVAGAPLGEFAWGGQQRVLSTPLRIGSVVSIAIYALFATVLLDRAAIISVFPPEIGVVGAWAIAAYGVLGAGMNAISRSRPEQLVMTPVALLIALGATLVALG